MITILKEAKSDISTYLEYIKDSIGEAKQYYDKHGYLTEDAERLLKEVYQKADKLYEQITLDKSNDLEEATSGIGAGAYTTQAIDLLGSQKQIVKKLPEA